MCVAAFARGFMMSRVPTSSTSYSFSSPAVPIVILGTDAVLAALPATPVQLAHACLRAGFANVIPASWGDEIIATAVLRRLDAFGEGPAIQCSCPIVAHRLLTVGADLRPLLLPLVPPPVAIARYVRALSPTPPTRITYVGACPGAVDESIDIRMTPEALIAMLGERDIALQDQPRVFESIIPPDRRRYRSMPGGVPTAEALWSEHGDRSLVELTGDDFVAEISQLVLSNENVLIDASPALGCACSGACGGAEPLEGRRRVMSVEPPRATAAVVQDKTPIQLDQPVPTVSRTPVDVVAVPPPAPKHAAVETAAPTTLADARQGQLFGHRISPTARVALVADAFAPRSVTPTASTQRPITGPTPVARSEGRALPRAYIARRRPSPRTTTDVATTDPQRESSLGVWHSPRSGEQPHNGSSVDARIPHDQRYTPTAEPRYVTQPGHLQPAQPSTPPPRVTPPHLALEPRSLFERRLVILIAAAAIAVGAGAALGVVVGRAMSKPSVERTAPDTGIGYP